jgi:hypothetical protein
MKKLNVKPQLAIITTIGMVAVLSAIILSQSTVLPMHNAYAKDKSTGNKKDSSQSDSGKADNTNDCSTSTDNQDNQDNGNGKADNTNDCSTSTDNQDNEENDNGNDKSNDS